MVKFHQKLNFLHGLDFMQMDTFLNSKVSNSIDDSVEKGFLRVGFVYHGASMQDLSNSAVALMISVGQHYHEGEKFEKTVLKLGQRCKNCVVMVNDTLQKYTLNIGNNHRLDYFYQVALENGNLWIQRNLPALKKMNIPYQIIRWDDWTRDEDYPWAKNKIDDLYLSNDYFRMAVKQTAENFISRFSKIHPEKKIDLSRDFELCVNYILEDCAVILPLWAKKGYKYVLYPNQRTPAMQVAYDFLVPHHLLHQITLKFKRKSFDREILDYVC